MTATVSRCCQSTIASARIQIVQAAVATYARPLNLNVELKRSLITAICGGQWSFFFSTFAFLLVWVTGMFAFTTCHVDCEIDVYRRQLRQPIFVFSRHMWTRSLSLRDGDQIGIYIEPGNGNHIVVCYRGRTRWRYTSFCVGPNGEREKLLAFVQSVADMLNIPNIGYGRPHRVLWW